MPDLIRTLPAEVYVPTVIVVALVQFWPRIREIWRDLLPRQRQLAKERSRLELLKLWYEVEAARKAAGGKGTNRIPDYLEPPSGGVAVEPRTAAPGGAALRMRTRFLWGIAGAFSISLLNFVTLDVRLVFDSQSGWTYFAGIATRYLVYMVVGAAASAITPTYSPRSAIVIGAVPALLLQAFIYGVRSLPEVATG